MLANGFTSQPCTDPSGHIFKPKGEGIQQCDSCKQKRYYDYETKSWRPTK